MDESDIHVNRQLDRVIIGDTMISVHTEEGGELPIYDAGESWVQFGDGEQEASLQFEKIATDGGEAVPAAIETRGDGENVAVVLNGEPLRMTDGFDHGVYCEGDLAGEPVRLRVTYDADGVHGVKVDWIERDLELSLDHAADSPDRGLRFESPPESMGHDATVEILPAGEAADGD